MFKTNMSTRKQTYVKKDQISHVLDRPDMYVGSLRERESEEFVVVDDDYHIEKKLVTYSPAALRIFIEPLSNVIDNVARSKKAKKPVTKICVDIDQKTGETTFWNDGLVIPIEKHDEGCYNHSLIFGHLLTSSNYDDEEDRLDISGRNGVGIKCLAKGTLIPMFNGSVKKIEDININDCVIGDDGTSRTVLNTVKGVGNLYKVTQPRGDDYIVNENHILSLKMQDHKVIFWNNSKGGWSVLWWDDKSRKILNRTIVVSKPQIKCPECAIVLSGNLSRHYKRMHPENKYINSRSPPTTSPPNTKEVKDARRSMEEFISYIPDNNIIDISISEYDKLSSTTRNRLSGFGGKCVKWEEKKVLLDPYVLGLWLGDGMKDGYKFSINNELDPEILNYLKLWGNKNDAIFTQNEKEPCSFSISSAEHRRHPDCDPLKKVLSTYNLINNKHIPLEYLVNSKETRLNVLAGLIDSDGHVSSNGKRITIAQGMNHKKFAKDIIFLAKSLGFRCSSHVKKTQWNYKSEIRRGKAININISGKGVEDIPTKVNRKKCMPPTDKNVTNTGTVTLTKVEPGEFVGLSIDGNQRFVLEDFTVTHNCTNVFSKEFTVRGLDPDVGKTFRQTWTNNMKNAGDPIVKTSKLKKGFTTIKYIPDFKQLKMKKGYTDDLIGIYKKYIMDMAMITKVDVYFNGELVPVKTLTDYANLYMEDETDEVLYIKTNTCEVVLTTSSDYQCVSFANGVCTPLGGTHVDAWSETLFRPIVEKMNKPKAPQINIKDVKNCFRLFVVASVANPKFESQNKCKLEEPMVEAPHKKTYTTKICKWSVMARLEDIIRSKEMIALKKVERKKRGHVKIEGLDSANNEGGKLGRECTLIIVEGLSAKTYAVSGVEVGAFGKQGRDWFGIYPLRGKCVSKTDPVLLWDGSVKQAQHVLVGDILINDLGNPTTVTKVFSGTDEMYEIQQTMADSYSVNSQHTLSLKISGHKSIVWDEKHQRWRMGWFDKQQLRMRYKCVDVSSKTPKKISMSKQNALKEITDLANQTISATIGSIALKYNIPKSTLQMHYAHVKTGTSCNCGVGSGGNQGLFRNKKDAYEEIVKFSHTIDDDDIIDINIQDYLKLPETQKKYLKGFRSNTCVSWDKTDVGIDPYILGLWLGDGSSNGYGFAGEDMEIINKWVEWARENNGEMVHNRKDGFDIRKCGISTHRFEVGSLKSNNEDCTGCKSKISIACAPGNILPAERSKCTGDTLNPLKKALTCYNLVNNKHIPKDYICNDKETRLKLLAGFIDSDGCVLPDGRIEITQCESHKNMIDSLVYIGRSLGFSVRTNTKKVNFTYNNVTTVKIAYRLTFSGNGISEIPTVLQRKKVSGIKFAKQGLNSGINVVPKGIGEYVGFTVNSETENHRFLLGDFTVTHNCLNTRNFSVSTIAKNKVVTDIIKALGIRTGVDYTDEKNYNTLRYGRIMILTDADVDGLHISGLVQNMIHNLFPSLLERKESFITAMQTPIVKVTVGRKSIMFYDERQYKKYATKYHQEYPNKKMNVKYYKGLGTSDEKTVMETFGVKILKLHNDERTTETMIKVFHKKYTDARKTWLAKYDPDNILLVWKGEEPEVRKFSMTDFINTEMIKFSMDDCKRSIPSIMDGLKESQRKILYVAFLRNLKYSGKTIKVAQFGASVAEKSGYHHGEKNLFDTMIKMAASFVGSNNIPLFFRDGQFGTRLQGGKDAASPRYIFTKLDMLTRIIFNSDDDELLERNEDDGDIVEPVQYMPIIPMILVNGCTAAIGTGWSSKIPCYNPLDLVNCIKVWLDNDGKVFEKINGVAISMFPDIKPWYRGFTGEIEADGGKFVSRGRIVRDKGKVIVEELPITLWTDDFKDSLESWKESKDIVGYKNHSTPKDVKFTITESPDGFSCNENNLKLTSNINLTNMVMITEEGVIKKFNSVEEIINHFCRVRFDYYRLRKKNNLAKMETEITLLGNKKRFLEEVLEGKIKLFTTQGKKKVARSTEDLVTELEERKYDKIFKKNSDSDEDHGSDHGYNYLLSMQIRSITAEKIDKLKNDLASIVERRDELAGTTEKDIWLADLDEFVKQYAVFLKSIEKESCKKPRKKRN